MISDLQSEKNIADNVKSELNDLIERNKNKEIIMNEMEEKYKKLIHDLKHRIDEQEQNITNKNVVIENLSNTLNSKNNINNTDNKINCELPNKKLNELNNFQLEE